MTPTDPATYYTPTIRLTLADGSVLLKHGKPVVRATAGLVSKWTGLSRKTLQRLAESGFISVAKVTPTTFLYYPAEVEDFIATVAADPEYWTPARKREYQLAR